MVGVGSWDQKDRFEWKTLQFEFSLTFETCRLL